MWLSGLHIPESYLSALVQTTCRRKNWPLDKSTLYTQVRHYGDPRSGARCTPCTPRLRAAQVTPYTSAEAVPGRMDEGCYVRGLYLEGAGWDLGGSCLARQAPKVLVVELPIMQVIPIEAAKLKLHGTFRTPVYVTQARRNAMGVGLVFEADLSTKEHPSHWVLQGVSLSLNTDQ